MQNKMTVSCIVFESDDHDLQLHYGDKLIACVKITFNEHGDFDTNCVLEKAFIHAPILSAIHATSIVLATVMGAWSTEHETVLDVFISNGKPLEVNPALYN